MLRLKARGTGGSTWGVAIGVITTVFLAILPLHEGTARDPAAETSAMDRRHRGDEADRRTAEASPSKRGISELSKIPTSFEKNVGQTDSQVRFLGQVLGGTAFFTPSKVVMSLPTASGTPAGGPRLNSRSRQNARSARQQHSYSRIVSIKFVNRNPNGDIAPGKLLPGVTHYVNGKDLSRSFTNIPHYSSITYREVFPGVSLMYEGSRNRLKGTYSVAPGADAALIKWRYEGAEGVKVHKGNLKITLPAVRRKDGRVTKPAILLEKAPVAWQFHGGRKRPVKVAFKADVDGTVGFSLGPYDRRLRLIIDPVIEYSTYMGGGGDDRGNAIAVDSDGAAYVTGYTQSATFPSRTPSPQNPLQSTQQKAFALKMAPDGSAVAFTTFIDNAGAGYGIAVDANKNTYVAGHNSEQKGFAAKLSPNGSPVYLTELGVRNSGDDMSGAADVAVDGRGNAYVVGDTTTEGFEWQGAFQTERGGGSGSDGFFVKLAPDGSRAYSTYIGGNSTDVPRGVALAQDGSVWIGGLTKSDQGFPTVLPIAPGGGALQGDADGFIMKFAPTGSLYTLEFSTYLGGSGNWDDVKAVAVDEQGDGYATGETRSDNFPTKNPIQPKGPDLSLRGNPASAFVTKVKVSGSSADLVYSTYLGGSAPGDFASDIAVDKMGRAYVTGTTYSQAFPTAAECNQLPVQAHLAGISDAFITAVNGSGSALVYSTYFGGLNDDHGDGIASDHLGTAYVTGVTRTSADFPTRNAYQPLYGGGFQDGWIAKLAHTRPELGCPPDPPTNLTAKAVSTSQIDLSWTPSPTGLFYKVERSLSPAQGWIQIGRADLPLYQDVGLKASTTYHYRVVANNLFGDSPPSNVASATTHAIGAPPAQAVPTVDSIEPNSGPVSGGTMVSIKGTNFADTTQVSFGEKAVTAKPCGASGGTGEAPCFTEVSTKELIAYSPATDAPKEVHVIVKAAGGQSAPTSSALFEYVQPGTPREIIEPLTVNPPGPGQSSALGPGTTVSPPAPPSGVTAPAPLTAPAPVSGFSPSSAVGPTTTASSQASVSAAAAVPAPVPAPVPGNAPSVGVAGLGRHSVATDDEAAPGYGKSFNMVAKDGVDPAQWAPANGRNQQFNVSDSAFSVGLFALCIMSLGIVSGISMGWVANSRKDLRPSPKTSY